MEDDRLTLDKALTLAIQIEEATQCAAKIAETNAAKIDVTSVPCKYSHGWGVPACRWQSYSKHSLS